MNDALQKLLALIKANDGINDKARLARIVFAAFGLTKDRSVYIGNAMTAQVRENRASRQIMGGPASAGSAAKGGKGDRDG